MKKVYDPASKVRQMLHGADDFPEEGVFDFDWLDHVLDRFVANEIYCFVATLSGAIPAWMSEKYP